MNQYKILIILCFLSFTLAIRHFPTYGAYFDLENNKIDKMVGSKLNDHGDIRKVLFKIHGSHKNYFFAFPSINPKSEHPNLSKREYYFSQDKDEKDKKHCLLEV